MSAQKRHAVHEAIAELDYHPSATARALASRRPRVIGIITGDTSRYGYAETIRGVEESARANNFAVTITVLEGTGHDLVERAVTATLAQSLAGVVVLKFDAAGVAMLERLPRDLPTVALSGVREPHTPQALLDETRAAEELVTHLLKLGHKTVHHVRIPPSRKEDGRTTGWRRALRNANSPSVPPLDATWHPSSGSPAGRAPSADPDVTAIFCGNDEIAMGVIRGLQDRGLRVPTDVSVAGFDDHPLATLWSPPLTTVDQNFADLGRRGFRLLNSQIDGNINPRQLSTARSPVIVRDSTGMYRPRRLS